MRVYANFLKKPDLFLWREIGKGQEFTSLQKVAALQYTRLAQNIYFSESGNIINWGSQWGVLFASQNLKIDGYLKLNNR